MNIMVNSYSFIESFAYILVANARYDETLRRQKIMVKLLPV